MYHLQNQVIEDTELILNNDVHNYLGPDLVLKGCRVILRTIARGLTMTGVKFIDCHFEAKRTLINCSMWCRNNLEGCSFTGRFGGNDFGHWPAIASNGSIKNCDFSGAVLDGCRFMDCDMASIKLPAWPCFTILNPHQRAAEFEAVACPGKFKDWFSILSWSPQETVALVKYAPALIKMVGGSEDELRKIMDGLDGILIEDC